MSGQRHYLRPIGDLREHAESLTADVANGIDGAGMSLALLAADLISELANWRELLGHQLAVEPCGIVTVMVGPEGAVQLVVERRPIRDGGVPDPRLEAEPHQCDPPDLARGRSWTCPECRVTWGAPVPGLTREDLGLPDRD